MGRPLAVRWGAHELPEVQAGSLAAVPVELTNVGDTPWRGDRFTISYHWLDDLGNAIVWDGLRTAVEAEPGATARVDARVRAPIPPGRYQLSLDVVDESRFWLGELGEPTLDFDVDVCPRVGVAVARLGDAVAEDGWDEQVQAAHREGFAVVGGSVHGRRLPTELSAYSPPGRVPDFALPLVCPSVLDGVAVEWSEVAGFPAARPLDGEPSLYDGRIRVRLPSGHRRG